MEGSSLGNGGVREISAEMDLPNTAAIAASAERGIVTTTASTSNSNERKVGSGGTVRQRQTMSITSEEVNYLIYRYVPSYGDRVHDVMSIRNKRR